MLKTNLQQQITVHALPSKVWRVLTKSEYVNQYFLNNNIHSNWMEGSPITASSENGKNPDIIGHVLESVPGLLLRFKLYEDTTSNFITTMYELIIANDGIELKLRSEGFNASQQEYLIRVQHANLILQKIKWLSEYA